MRRNQPDRYKKMKIRLLSLASMLMLSMSAQAEPVAGWDFSQYQGPGSLSRDGSTFTNTLPANYSSLVPGDNLGPLAAGFGTMYANGSNGSSAVPASATTTALRPTAGSLESNIRGSAEVAGDKSFDALTSLAIKGQPFTQRLAMKAESGVDLVFGVDLTGVSSADTYSISFGGGLATLAGSTSRGGGVVLEGGCGGSASVDVEFSTDGSSYSFLSTETITDVDQEFTVPAPAGASSEGFFRLGLAPSGGCLPVIDNVAIEATLLPEPGSAAMMLTGIACLLALPRRR
jgi:hypothetical protein